MSDKSEKLEAQLGSIRQQLLKWNVELNDFQKWDLDNNGILDDAEKATLNSRKAELAQILKRLENIAKLKGLNLPVGKAVDGLKDSIKNNFEERTNSEEFNIPKSKFGSEMKAWIGALRDNLSLLKEDLTPLKADLLVLEIRNSFAQDPVNLFLAELITKNIRGNTRGEISASVFTGLNEMYDDNFWEIKFSTEKSWRSAYKKDKSMIDQLPKVENTVAFFKSKSFEDKTDPKHQENIKQYKEEFEKFKTIFVKGISNEKNEIESITTNGDTSLLDFRIIDETKLLANKDEIDVASYAKGFKDNIVNSLYNFTKNNKMTTVIEIKRIAKTLLTDNSSDEALKSLFIEYKNSKSDITPTGFASWINLSAVNIDLKSFEKHYKENWADKVIGAVDSFQRDSKSKGISFKADRSLLDNNLKRILGLGIGKNNKQPGLEIHKKFMDFLPADKVLDYALIDTAWQKTLREAVKDEFMKELCSNYFIENAENKDAIEDAINSVDTILPNIDAIVVELYNSRYYEKPLPKPTSKDALLVRTIINKAGREKQKMDLVLEVPLRFEIRKGKNNEMLYHPVPSQDQSDVSIRNSFGFNISKVQNVYVGKTLEVTKSGYLETITDYCWRLSVTDSSEQTVIQEAKLGEMFMVDASMGDLKGVKELGLNPLGFQVKIVGDQYGNVDKILGKITIMGLPFVVGNSKDGPVGYFENPLAYTDAVLQYKYGNKNMDLYISCQVRTFIGADYSINVETSNVKLGMQNGAFAPEELILSNSISNKIVIERPGKVE